MIAMQYRFRLPATYDMGIITTRVRENGHRLDNFPGLIMKAWCYARGEDAQTSPEPLYAPFYLWQDGRSMAHFLQSDGFKKLIADFGRPDLDSWLVLNYQPGERLAQAAFARREITPLAANDALPLAGRSAPRAGNVTRIVACDVQRWRWLDFQLSDRPFDEVEGTERYRLGHLSLPTAGEQKCPGQPPAGG